MSIEGLSPKGVGGSGQSEVSTLTEDGPCAAEKATGYRPPHRGEKGLQYGRVELRHRTGGDRRPQECPIFSQKEEETPVWKATVREARVGSWCHSMDSHFACGLTFCRLFAVKS